MAKNKKMKKKSKLIITIVAFAAIVIVVAIASLSAVDDDVVKTNGEEPINENFTFLVDSESTLIFNDDVFAEQMELKRKYTEKFEKGNYTIDKPYVVTNPYGLSPLTALVMFETKKSESVKVTIKGKHNDDLVVEFEESKEHILPIYGLYGSGYTNTVIIETESGKTNSVKIKIDDVVDTGEVEVLQNDLGNTNGDFYFSTSSLGVGSIAYDNYGEVRWWLTVGYAKGMTMLANGHILLSSANEGPDFTSTSGVVELDMLGFVHREYEIEGGYHHDGLELPNGNLIILTSDLEVDYDADHIVEIDRETGKQVKEWSLRDTVSEIDPNLISSAEITWAWINSIYYDEKTDSFILSVRNRNSVVSIDYSSGDINWILGESKYWSRAFNRYLIRGTGSNFIYPAGQHSVYITDDGKLSIFNNGYNAHKEEAVLCKDMRGGASYGMIYNLNFDNMTATVDWSYGGEEYFSYALSSFTYASDGHKVFNSGWHFTDEVAYDDPECTQFSNDKYDAYFIEFDENNNIVLKLHVLESKFEVVKANIYNLEAESVKPKSVKVVDNYENEKGKYLTSFEPDPYETLTEEEALKYEVNEDCFITFRMYNDRIRFLGVIPLEMDFKVTLISPKGTAYRFSMKEENEEMKEFLNLSVLPRGRYYVYVNMGEFVYNTTEYIELD